MVNFVEQQLILMYFIHTQWFHEGKVDEGKAIASEAQKMRIKKALLLFKLKTHLYVFIVEETETDWIS